MRIVFACVALALLAGCAGERALSTKGPKLSESVAKLPEVSLPEVRVPPPTRADVMAAYRRIYGTVPDPQDNLKVGKRLADLEMQAAEDTDATTENQAYKDAIALYEELLSQSSAEGRDEVLYQLARAYDVVGDAKSSLKNLNRLISEYPQSRYVVEARFRRAEIAFSAEHYSDAAADYAFVVDHGADSQYWLNANYMLGWSRFKTGDLESSLHSFFAVTGSILERGENLDRGAQELLNDTLRVVVLGVTYLDGANTLAENMERLGKPSWQHLVYEHLADEYKTRQRYLDSVATLEAFIQHNPLDRRAPVFHQRVIDTLIAANFPSEIRARKEDFVRRYGITSEFWKVHPADERAEYMGVLKSYTVELSHLVHSEAQATHDVAKYLAAADYYEQFVAAFPEDPAVAENLFLLGEALTEAKRPRDAVAAYQRVVREHPDYAKANEAGYAAILGLDAVVAAAPDAERETWKHARIDAQIEFAMVFPGDTRAPTVEASAADALFKLGDYKQSMDLATHLIDTRKNLDPKLARTAYLILGHGHFEQGDFVAAEQSYRALLKLPSGGESNAEVEQKLLAAIYKQGENAEKSGAADEAVQHYLRIAQEAPGSDVAAKGHYDAVGVLESQSRWKDAAALLADFRTRYPSSDLAKDLGKRLASLYEKAEDWPHAAREYRDIAAHDASTEVRREALYHAGELALKTDDVSNAIVAFRDYAKDYPAPPALALEAMQQLDVLYKRTGQIDERRYWLGKKIELADREGKSATDRMRFLAAEAQMVFADDARHDFDQIAIVAPLKKSLERKQGALKKALAGYEKAAAYGVSQFQTASTFQIADLYATLARSLLDSERPKGLSKLELDQYETLLEEQADPFEEQAISIHQINVERSWSGTYDEWVQRSFGALKALMPARFDREELEVSYVHTIQ